MVPKYNTKQILVIRARLEWFHHLTKPKQAIRHVFEASIQYQPLYIYLNVFYNFEKSK